jgi:transglutaminase-like putative cysteine protease
MYVSGSPLSQFSGQSRQRVQTLRALPDGAAGTKKTLAYMREYVGQCRINPRIRELALAITAGLPGKDYLSEAVAVQAWVRGNIRYIRDVNGIETLQSPIATLELRQGDCDDHATLVGALLESIGAQTRFVAVGMTPGEYEHVYCEVFVPHEGWLSVETTENVPVGWEPGDIRARLVSRET